MNEIVTATLTDLPGAAETACFTVGDAYRILYTGALVILGIILLCCLVRAIRGPRIADRVIAINMMSTDIVIIICVLALMLQEGYLADIAMVYTMLSFLAVVLLAKIYMGSYRARRSKTKEMNKDA